MIRPVWEKQPAVLYHCIGSDDRPVYIGATTDLTARLNSHRALSWWWGEVVRVDSLPYGDRDEALAAERHAIRTEHPRYNMRSIDPDRGPWDLERYMDQYRAHRRSPNYYVASVRNRADLLEAEMRERFGVPA